MALLQFGFGCLFQKWLLWMKCCVYLLWLLMVPVTHCSSHWLPGCSNSKISFWLTACVALYKWNCQFSTAVICAMGCTGYRSLQVNVPSRYKEIPASLKESSVLEPGSKTFCLAWVISLSCIKSPIFQKITKEALTIELQQYLDFQINLTSVGCVFSLGEECE